MKLKIPYAKNLPLVGHLFPYLRDRIKLLEDLKRKHGDIFKLKIGPKTLTIITNPADVQRIMQTNMKNYYKSTNLEAIFGKGIFLSNDEEWKSQRNIINQFFNLKYIEQCIPAIEKSTAKFFDENFLNKENHVDINDIFTQLTFDVIMTCMVGVDLGDNFHELHSALNSVTSYLTRSSYSFVKLPKLISKNEREFAKNIALIDKIVYAAIDKQKQKNIQRPSLITKFIEIQKTNPAMTDTKIRDNIVTMMFAGYETTALSMSWLCLLLASKPEIQNQVRDELKAFGAQEISVASLASLKFSEASISEAIRLYPPGWAWTRVAREDDSLRDYEIKKGDIVLIVPYLIQRDPLYWKNPEDFSPERFLGGAKDQTPFSFLPFGGGPRICLGMQFSYLEMKIIFLKLLTKYELKRSGPMPGVAPEATLHSAEGFKLTIKKI